MVNSGKDEHKNTCMLAFDKRNQARNACHSVGNYLQRSDGSSLLLQMLSDTSTLFPFCVSRCNHTNGFLLKDNARHFFALHLTC